ncbi:hypothetical protein V3C99_008685 [Haemonchus contortus]
MPSLTPRNRRSEPDTLCDVVMTVGPVQLLTESERQDGVNAMIRLLYGSCERKEWFAPCPSSEYYSLD